MKILIFLTACALVFSQPVMADEKSEILKITKERIDLVIQTLKRKDIDKKTRDKKIIDTVMEIFDFQRMAKLCLGKKHWKRLNKEQRKEFLDLFEKRLQESYLEKLDLYTDEKVVIEEAKRVKKRIYIMTYLVSKDDKIEMIYKFYKSKKGWKVYDVEIAGVSIVQTYRSQFAGVLKKGTIDDLLKKLRRTDQFIISAGEKKKN